MNTFKSLMLASMASISFASLADVANGSFENWSNGLPTNWTTIDSGINVQADTATVKEGSNSAKITVTTGSQAATDFRQSVAVTAGQSYQFSVWLYHTEGHVKARLYVDGYQGYSNNSLTNQWQQLSFNYTATTSKSIDVGLRFYDQTGFDGNEAIYVDYFQPTAATSTTPPTGGTGGNSCSATPVNLTLTTDDYGYETSWQLTNSSNATVDSGSNLASAKTFTNDYCLADDSYTFTINDQYGDGICCSYGNGHYSIKVNGTEVASGGSFARQDVKTFTITSSTGGNTGGGNTGGNAATYYDTITTQTGYSLKTALFSIINNHTSQGYSAIWGFYAANSLDNYYEKDGTILDLYAENPTGTDSYNYTKVTNQCGSYSGEGGCYNREHSFPKSWFGGMVEPMASDIHHIFATDGYVNMKRSSYPYGEVASATFTSTNGSKLGSASATLGYSGTVFEPIDEFKGDLARAYFYMATRYQDKIATWQTNSSYGDAVLNGTADQVFEPWVLAMLKRWHQQDPVSQREIDRNNAAFTFQGNRNPFIDHPEYVSKIWGN